MCRQVLSVLILMLLVAFCSGCSDDALQLPQMVEEISVFRDEYTCDGQSDYVVVYAVTRIEGQPFLVPLSVPLYSVDENATSLEAALRLLSNPPITPGAEFEWPWAGRQLVSGDKAVEENQSAAVVTCHEGEHYGALVHTSPNMRKAFSAEEYLLARQVLAYTLTEFSNIDTVVFDTDQQPFERNEHPLNGAANCEDYITVYYQLGDTSYLVPISFQASPERSERIAQALERLFKEPQGFKGLQSVFENGYSVCHYESGNVLYIDMDYKLLLAVINGRTDVGKALEAVTATLTQIENVEKIQVLVNGKVVGSLGSSGLDLSVPLTRMWVNRLLP